MESKIGGTGGIIEERHSSDIQGDQMEGESGVTPSAIDELHSLDIQLDQMAGESGVTRSVIDELEISKEISKDIKWKEKVMLLEVPLTNFILKISKEIK